MTQWERIFKTLKAAGLDVYSPGQHQGECTAPYVVLKDSGVNGIPGFSSNRALYDILCYVPQKRFSTLEGYIETVKTAMKPLDPEIKPMQSQTGSFLDDVVKGHMVSIQYRSNHKI